MNGGGYRFLLDYLHTGVILVTLSILARLITEIG